MMIKKTLSFEEDDITYLETVAKYLGGDKPIDLSKTVREVIRYHRDHPANAAIKRAAEKDSKEK